MRTSLEVADIFRAAGPAYRAVHAGHLSLTQLKVMTAIENCRTAALGGHVEACEDCGHWRIAYNSCRNRHCPKCQGAAARTWLAEREADLLPVGYFHVVFTLPAEIASIAFQNKAVVYDLLFKAASETMLTIAADPKHLGARIGITAVLHTWGSALTHHPHVHMVVPGGGIATDGSRWISTRPAFLLPVRVLGKLFRRLFLNRLFISFDKTGVTLRYKDYRRDGPERQSIMTLATDEFIRRFLAHVLPRGFHRIRHYGLLASSSRKANLARARTLLEVTVPPDDPAADEPADLRPPCPCCGGHMVIIETFERWRQPRAPPNIPIRIPEFAP